MLVYTRQNAIIKYVRHIGTKNTTCYYKHIITSTRAASCYGKNIYIMTARDISNWKSETTDFHKQQKRGAMQKTTTCVEILCVKFI